MKPITEPPHLLPDESFCLLQWNDYNITDVKVIGTDGETYPFKGEGDVWHCHAGMELVLITHGAGTRFMGDSITTFKAIDLVLAGSNLPHCWHTPHKLSGYAAQFNFGPEHAFWKFPETMSLRPLWKNTERGIQFTGRPAGEAAALIQTMPGKGGVERLALFMMVLAKLQRAPPGAWKLLSKKSFPPSHERSGYRGIQKAIHLLLNCFHEDISFTDVLKESCMSKATFERQFKKHTGKTLTRFLTEVRIDAVRRQLIETGLSIGEIAFASGFNSLSHFHHQFELMHGETPGSFRRRMKTAAKKNPGGSDIN